MVCILQSPREPNKAYTQDRIQCSVSFLETAARTTASRLGAHHRCITYMYHTRHEPPLRASHNASISSTPTPSSYCYGEVLVKKYSGMGLEDLCTHFHQ